MNYWLLTTEYPPFHGGGISTYCYYTARMLSEAGHAVTVLVADEGVTSPVISQETSGIRVVRCNSDRAGMRGYLGYTARLSYSFAEMVREMVEREGKPDCIEAQDYQGIAYYLLQYKHLGYSFMEGVPVVITLHSPAFIYLDYNRVPVFRFPEFWTGEMEKQSIAGADHLISPTAFLVEEIGKYMDILHREVTVLPNPYRVEAPDVPPFTRNKIVYYGKLSPQKGSFELLAYFKELWDDGFGHPLHMVGGTDIVYHPERQTMGQLVHKRYAPYLEKGLLRLHGKIQPGEIEACLRDAHVLIVPSIVDNLPYVVMEAMSLGKIVLVSRQGGQREMVEEGVSGFIFDHSQEGSFREQLERILHLSDDDIRSVGRRAQERVRERYSFETIGPAKMALIEAVSLRSGSVFPFVCQEPRKLLPSGGDAGLLSVVIPYYNMGRYIDECIRSVLESTYRPLEIVLIDDGSTEMPLPDQLALVGSSPEIRVIRKKNEGLAEARNDGAKAARGEFLAFLDADDKVGKTYYEKAIRALRKNENVFFVGAWVQYFENSRAIWPTFTPQPPYALVHNPVNSSGLVYKRAAFLAAGLNDKKVDYGLEDYESVINMLKHGYNGVVLPEVLFHYRVRHQSMFRQLTREKLLYSYHYIGEKHADYYAKFASQVFNLLNSNGPGFSFDNPTDYQRTLLKRKLYHYGEKMYKEIVRRYPWIKRWLLRILPKR